MKAHTNTQYCKLDQSKQEVIAESWSDLADWYEKKAEMFSIQGAVTCAAHAIQDTGKPQRVLEVACGPGRHSLMVAGTFLKPDGSVLVSCDISRVMVSKLSDNYSNSDFALVPGNEFVADLDVDVRFRDQVPG